MLGPNVPVQRPRLLPGAVEAFRVRYARQPHHDGGFGSAPRSTPGQSIARRDRPTRAGLEARLAAGSDLRVVVDNLSVVPLRVSVH
jgi:hypothetical protein